MFLVSFSGDLTDELIVNCFGQKRLLNALNVKVTTLPLVTKLDKYTTMYTRLSLVQKKITTLQSYMQQYSFFDKVCAIYGSIQTGYTKLVSLANNRYTLLTH